MAEHGRQDSNLKASWREDGNKMAVSSQKAQKPIGKCEFLGSKVLRTRASVTSCAGPVEDEVFGEEESAESEGGLARQCHPDYVRGRRIETRRAFRQAALRAGDAP